MSIGDDDVMTKPDPDTYSLPERWILSRLQHTSRTVNAALASYDLDDACNALHEFLWNEYCDWFVELCKPALNGEEGEAKERAKFVLVSVLESTLRLLHPVMPFVTEEIWQALPHVGESICSAAYPRPDEALVDLPAEAGMALLIDSVTALRTLRAEFTPGGQENEAARAAILARRFTVTAVPETDAARATLTDQLSALTNLARLGTVTIADAGPVGARTVATGVAGATFHLPADELLEGVDPVKESARLALEITKLEKERGGLEGRLNNPQFVERALPEVVEKARADSTDLTQRIAKLAARREMLGG